MFSKSYFLSFFYFFFLRDDSNILACIPTTNIFIEAGVEHGGVLVHCFGGKSRSPAFIVAYLMSCYNMAFDEAYNCVKAVRPAAEINLGFECQLRAYSLAGYDVYAAQQLLLRTRIRELHFVRNTHYHEKEQQAKHNFKSSISSSSSHSNIPPRYPGPIQLEPIASSNNLSIQTEDIEHNLPPKRSLSRNKRSFSDAKTLINLEESGNMDIDNTDLEESYGNISFSPLDREYSNESANSESLLIVGHAAAIHPAPNSLESETGTDNLEESFDMESCNSANSKTSQSSFSNSNKTAIATNQFDPHNGRMEIANSPITFQIGSEPVHPTSATKTGKSGTGRTPSRSHSSRSTSNDPKAKYPSCRLSRPGTSWVRVIPPLRALEREFRCSWCNSELFQLANVIRLDMNNILSMVDSFQTVIQNLFKQRRAAATATSFGASSAEEAEDAFILSRMNKIEASTPRASKSSSSYILPPIRKASTTGTLFPKGIGMDMDIDNQSSSEIQINEPILQVPPPMKTTRASQSINKGFNFDSVSYDKNSPREEEERSVVPTINTSRTGSILFPSIGSDTGSPKVSPRLLTVLTKETDSIIASSPRQPLSSNKKPIFSVRIDDSNNKEYEYECDNSQESPIMLQNPPILNSQNAFIPVKTNSSNSGSFSVAPPPNHFDESPRVSVPPHRIHAGWSSHDRPKSSEKRRWLARANLIREGHNALERVAEADEFASQSAFDHDKYFHIEYLDWMGADVLDVKKDNGEICCPGCKHIVGSWSWNPSRR